MTATFLFSDVLSTACGASTNYQLTVKGSGGGQVWNEMYYLTGTAANLNVLLPSCGPGAGGMTVTGSVATLVLETNGTVNSDQLLLNLVAGTNITLTNSAGSTTINAATSTFSIPSRTGLIGYNFAGGGTVVATAIFGAVYLPVSMTATGWVLTADQTGTTSLAIMATSYGSYPAMTATLAAPALTGAIKNENLTMTAVALPAGSLVEFSVTSASLVQTLNVGLIMTIPYA
jgi:hypothetical protein